MPRVRWTIKRKLLALGAATLIPVGLLIVFWVRWEVREHTEEMKAELTLASRQAAGQVEALLRGATEHLDALAQSPAVQRRQAAWMEKFFREVEAGHPDFENLLFFDPVGRMVAAAVPSPAGAPIIVADRPWFQRVMATGRPVVGGFQIGRITGHPVAVVAIPLREGDGPPAGVLAAGVSLRRLHLLFQSLPLVGGMTVTVVDGEGQVLSHAPNTEGWIGRRLLSDAALQPEPGVVTTLVWPEGGERVAAMASVAGADWRVLVGVPRASLETRMWKGIRAIALPLFGWLLLAGIVGLLIARRVWTPLEELAKAVRVFERGETVRAPVTSADEVGELARAFNEMAEAMERTRWEERGHLEEMVEQAARLQGLIEIAGRLTRTLEMDPLLREIAEEAARLLKIEGAGFRLLEGDQLVLGARYGLANHVMLTPSIAVGESLSGLVVKEGRPIAVPDLSEDERYHPAHKQAAVERGIVAFLGVPVRHGDEVIGVLNVYGKKRQNFGDHDVALLAAFADQAAVAIKNARLFEETRARAEALDERNRQLLLLHLASRFLSTEHDQERLLQRIVGASAELIGARYGALAVFGDDGKIARFFTAGIDDETRERIGHPPEGRGLLGHVFREGKTLRMDDLTAHPHAAGLPLHHPVMRNLLAAPIRYQEKILGALYLAEKEGKFTADDENLLTTLSADAAVAMENARLLGELKSALEEIKAAQERVVRSATLSAVGELAAGAAHHLNNLLAVIVGRAQILLRTARDPSLERPLKIVERAALDGAEVVRRIQQFSRARPGGEFVTADLNQIAQDALEFTRPRWQDEAQSQGRLIETALEAEPIPPASGQPSELREVMVNLILNAVDALPEGGRIVLRSWRDGRFVSLSVGDTGVGMPPEVRSRAFEPFFSTKGVKSTGLGLSVVHGIIKRHGGEITIESEEGKGTTVTLRLPAVERQEPAAKNARGRAGRRARVLVIDDEPEVREALADLLGAEGHVVSCAADGPTGLATLEREAFDLVITDLGMPGMTGWQVAEAVKSRFPSLPVLLVTGWANTLEPGEAERVDGVLTKPFQIDAVRGLLDRVLPATPLGGGTPSGNGSQGL